MPVILNEPSTVLQRHAGVMLEIEDQIETACNFEDPTKRITYLTVAFLSSFSSLKCRKKKPFNAMLGETYEFVTDKFKYVSEKVQHNPHDILAEYMEGKSYVHSIYHKVIMTFKFWGGRDMMEVNS